MSGSYFNSLGRKPEAALFRFAIGIKRDFNRMPSGEEWEDCRRWLICYFLKKAVDREIPFSQVAILADMHLNNLKADAFQSHRERR